MTAVARHGLAAWVRDPAWPVNPGETRALSLAVIDGLARAAQAARADWADCIWSVMRYGDLLVQHMLAAAVTQRAQRANRGRCAGRRHVPVQAAIREIGCRFSCTGQARAACRGRPARHAAAMALIWQFD